jgi:hypothetical protein
MKKTGLLLRLMALLLCTVLLCPTLLGASTAYADEGEEELWVPTDPMDYGILNPAELTKIVSDYCNAWGLNKSKISIGYCYLDTGDTWYYNGDTWYYSAETYKVPLLMILAEWEAAGSITQDTEFKGLKLSQLENYTLVYNSNDYAHQVMNLIGTDKECRQEYQKYSSLPEKYYSEDFYEYSYFTARFLTDVIKTLYYENERFPHIIDWMKQADQWKYFHGGLNAQYEVAQKFGTFTDKRGVAFNHCTGIVYTEHPFVLTVMTEGMGVTQNVLKDMAVQFKNYTLGLDEAYAAWQNAGNTVSPSTGYTDPAPVEQPPVEQQPAENPPAENPPAEGQQPEQQPTENPPAEGQQPAVEQPPEQPADGAPEGEQPEQQPGTEAPTEKGANLRVVVIILNAVLLVILLLGWITVLLKKNRSAGRNQR